MHLNVYRKHILKNSLNFVVKVISLVISALHILYRIWQRLMGCLRQKHSEGSTYQWAQAKYHHRGMMAAVPQEVDDGRNHSTCPSAH